MSPKTMYPDLCSTFKELAAWTWNKLDKANRLEMVFNEETITESLLLKLAERHAGRDLAIRAYTKAEEGKGTAKTGTRPTGADWSFWFSDQKTKKGIEVRVQAKRLFKSGSYESLDGSGKQLQVLRRNAGKAIPLFVFYNMPLNPNMPWFEFQHMKQSCMNCDYWWPYFVNISVWGCTYAPVAAIPKKKKPEPLDIKPMKPWHCLVCEGSHGGSTPPRSLPERVMNSLKTIYDQAESGSRGDQVKGTGKISWELRSEAPEWTRLLNENQSADDGDSSNSRPDLDQYLDTHELRGVVLIEETSRD